MALSLDTLTRSLTTIGYPESGALAAQAFTSAYHSYAATAQDPAGNLVAVTNPEGLLLALTAQLSSTEGSAESAAEAFASGFAAFWATASFTPLLPALGVSIGGNGIMAASASSLVSSVSPAQLQQDLLALFLTQDASGSNNLGRLANILHQATLTSIGVTLAGIDTTPPPAGPIPTVFIGNLI